MEKFAYLTKAEDITFPVYARVDSEVYQFIKGYSKVFGMTDSKTIYTMLRRCYDTTPQEARANIMLGRQPNTPLTPKKVTASPPRPSEPSPAPKRVSTSSATPVKPVRATAKPSAAKGSTSVAFTTKDGKPVSFTAKSPVLTNRERKSARRTR